MYIPEFWCGVGACILAEIVLIFIAAVICAIPNRKRKEDNNELH